MSESETLVERLRQMKSWLDEAGRRVFRSPDDEALDLAIAAISPSAPTPTCGWQTIETIPAQRNVWIYDGDAVWKASCDHGTWFDEDGYPIDDPHATHWRDIERTPDPPAVSRPGEAE